MHSTSVLTFNYDEIITRYNEFITGFLCDEINVVKEELLPRFWTIAVPSKGFYVTIELRNIGNEHGVEQWCAIVKESDGEETNYLLFAEEIEQWGSGAT
ncbi:hypothetical protein [Alkalihalophilus marmarensis]|uniref:Uncharacterized protein n=1 Tax=Alkalihalophilus marmarensis DSM 21297 TaxID=1188261 RepID=U6SUG4_9BACI|nr:hypothetical protein [Alkalihalophilus marmarensis]ERN54301.1 hypothetical protein A33I_07695 [Alkalihalophilus marmarensis DSM 21297]